MDDKTSEIRERDIQKRAFSFACRIINLYRFIAQQESVGEILGRQLLRSGTSIGANLEEATAAQSKAELYLKMQHRTERSPRGALLATAFHRNTSSFGRKIKWFA
jgi:hypothetical protein